MTENESFVDLFASVRAEMQSKPLADVKSTISAEAESAMQRHQTAIADDSTTLEKVGAYMSSLGMEVCARLLTLAERGELDTPAADQLITRVGGALDMATHALVAGDSQGVQEALELTQRELVETRIA